MKPLRHLASFAHRATLPDLLEFLGIALPALVLGLLAFLAVLTASSAMASEEIAEAEGGLTCTVCHDKPGSKLLTDKGKYYEATGSLEGFDQVIEAFRACTTCHVKKPGSDKFTPRGKRFVGVMTDMKELRDWAMKAHPQTEDVMTPVPPPEAMDSDESARDGDDGEEGGNGGGASFSMMRSSRE